MLDVGAGTGRVALDAGPRRSRVTALDSDRELLGELARRAPGLESSTVRRRRARVRARRARSRCASCRCRRSSCSAAPTGARAFLRCARRASARRRRARGRDRRGARAVRGRATAPPAPLPDIVRARRHRVLSQPTAVRREGDAFVLERRRETVTRRRRSASVAHDLIRARSLDRGRARARGRREPACARSACVGSPPPTSTSAARW